MHDLKLYLFTQDDMEIGKEITYKDVNYVEENDITDLSSRPTVVIIHGFASSKDSTFNEVLKKGYLSNYDVNLFVCDWSVGSKVINYFNAIRDVSVAGKYLAELLDFLHDNNGLDYKTLTLVGYSLGAHVAGVAGKNIQRDKIGTIIGLDPARPGFSISNPSNRLADTDAQYVESIHTDKLLGIHYPISQVDFFVNNGEKQPGCFPLYCSHRRVVDIFYESLTSTELIGRKCEDFKDILDKTKCDGVIGIVGGSPFITKYNEQGIYQLYTTSTSPYGMN